MGRKKLINCRLLKILKSFPIWCYRTFWRKDPNCYSPPKTGLLMQMWFFNRKKRLARSAS